MHEKDAPREGGFNKNRIGTVQASTTSCLIFHQVEEELTAMYRLLWRILSATVGIIAIVVTLTKYPQYLNTLHENKLWFSNIKVSLSLMLLVLFLRKNEYIFKGRFTYTKSHL